METGILNYISGWNLIEIEDEWRIGQIFDDKFASNEHFISNANYLRQKDGIDKNSIRYWRIGRSYGIDISFISSKFSAQIVE